MNIFEAANSYFGTVAVKQKPRIGQLLSAEWSVRTEIRSDDDEE